MLEEDRKRRQFEEQKQKLRLLSSVKPKVSLPPHLVYFTIFLSCPLHTPVTLWTLDTLLFCTQTGEKSRDDALEAIKGNLDGFSRDAKMHPTPSSQTKKPGTFTSKLLDVIPLDSSCCASASADLLSVAVVKCLRLRIIAESEAGQHDDWPAGSQTNQN